MFINVATIQDNVTVYLMFLTSVWYMTRGRMLETICWFCICYTSRSYCESVLSASLFNNNFTHQNMHCTQIYISNVKPPSNFQPESAHALGNSTYKCVFLNKFYIRYFCQISEYQDNISLTFNNVCVKVTITTMVFCFYVPAFTHDAEIPQGHS